MEGHIQRKQRGMQGGGVYQSRSRDRLFGAGYYVGFVVNLQVCTEEKEKDLRAQEAGARRKE